MGDIYIVYGVYLEDDNEPLVDVLLVTMDKEKAEAFCNIKREEDSIYYGIAISCKTME